ncbi:uncharacterized protein PV09_07556 [Verruconis gallopava]|uniref:BZIP domain-containing protein n=1 Tax=Verruconis gallopava TaxID=253628 RepID=A0A0D1XFT7_9PEZI|nr:uncharacterized protein PV09_07556 [Verruconis gallopava]KIW01041.1 hypothetical protein PV09_07556 [Verruconis gallopava]
MAFAPSVDFQRPPSQLSVDRKPAFLDEFDPAEESFMDSTLISPAEDRRDSFGNATGPVFSPSTVWDDFAATPAIPDRPFGSSTNPFVEHSNNPFLRQDSASYPTQHTSQWPTFDHGPESRGPMGPSNYESYSAEFEPAPAQAFPHGGPFGPMPPSNVRPASIFPPSQTPVPMSASPPPVKDWMSMAEQAHMDARLSKRPRGHSPARYPPSYRHGDGIRKKNARFDIPQERNLANIDRLIENAKDEDEIKELKQQKRLLRNRQAALDSRQRKKQRAEELEVDNKTLRDQIAEMNERLSMLQMQAEQATREKNELLRENAQLKEHLQQSNWDKENLIVEHTKDTGALRKKIQVLEEIIENRDSSESTRQSSTDYDFPIVQDMHGLADNGLDMYGMDDSFGDFVMDEGPFKPMETSTLVLAPKKKPEEEKEAQSGPSGLLMLLLLCGAWVASKATTSMPVTIPRMPDEVRSDAAVVFDDLMKDHGVSTFQASSAVEPAASSAASVRQTSFSMSSTSATSKLDEMHSRLTQPSRRQEAEAAFSLSAKQYNSLTSSEFAEPPYNTPPEDDSQPPSHRRHLVDTLKAMREEAKGQATASVYTRSLLWERIPDDVVQQFKRMAEHSSQTASVNGDGGE